MKFRYPGWIRMENPEKVNALNTADDVKLPALLEVIELMQTIERSP